MTTERPEHELLRLCVRRRLAPTDEAHIVQLVEHGLDWPYLLSTGARHQILPLLNECLAAARGGASTPAPVKALGRWLETARARNRRAAQELVRLHRGATTAGIPMLSFKGPTLASKLYGDLGSRQFGDLDLLVHPASFSSAEEFFVALGYRRSRDYGYEVTFVDDSTRVCLDLHHALSPDNFPVSVSFARLWERRETVELEGGCVETFSAADLALALCIEAVKDARLGNVKLGKMSDLAHLFGTLSETDLTQAALEARRLGIEQVLCFAIRLAADILKIPAVEPPRLIARPRRWARFLREAEEALFEAPNTRRPTRRHGDLFHFHIRERWRDKVRPYVLSVHRLVTPTAVDRSMLALPHWLSLLYYLVRPVRLAHRYGTRFMRQRNAAN
jgi:putative nucleotidyltransferase-like protein